MALNFLNNGIFAGEVTISTIPAVGSDTDKFLMSNSGVISFATGAEVLSFIGGAPATGGDYLPLAGGIMTGPIESATALQINAASFIVKNAAGDENMLSAFENGAVNLYYDGGTGVGPKLSTTSLGVSITGTVNGTLLRVKATDGNTTSPSFGFASVTNTGMYLPSSSTLAFVAVGSQILTLNGTDDSIKFDGYDSTNNVGTPTYILGTDASGNVVKVLGGDIPGGGGTVTGSGTTNYIPMWTSSTALGNSVVFQTGTNRLDALVDTLELSNDWTIQSTDGSYWQRIRTADGSLDTTNAFNFETRNGSGSFINHMTILNSGNVGIGVTGPAVPLDVEGKIRSSNDNSGEYLEMFNDGDGTGNSFITSSSGELIIKSPSDISFLTNSSERVRIEAGGNVGIGTTNPFTNLEIEGSGLDSIIRLYAATGAANIRTWEMRAVGVAGEGLLFRQVNDANTVYTNRMILDNSGKVGIGTTGPGVPLDVVGDIRTTTRYLISTGTANQNMAIGYWDGSNARIEAGSALPMLITSYQGNIKLGINGGTTMTVQSSNVGIGITSPGAKLDVSDGTIYSIKLSNTAAYNSGINNGIVFNGKYTSAGDVTDMASVRGGKENTVDTHYGGKLTFHTRQNGLTDTERMRITSVGGISFGSTGTAYGTSGEILKSNGNASPTWVAASTVIGGPYLPLTGGTLSGPGNLTIEGTLTGTTASFNSGATNVVASFTSTDGTAGIALIDNSGNVELSASGNTFQVQPAGGVAALSVTSTTATFTGDIIIPNGKINTIGGNNLTISGTVASHAGISFATNSILPCVIGAITNNVVDLGQNGNVYKNLYLGSEIISGGGATFAGKVITTELESTGALLLDAVGDITIDAGGGDIILSDDATIFGTISSSGGMQIRSRVNNADMFFRGVDDGTEFNALTLDMSEGGNATFGTQAFATTATSSGDASSTLTTKGYVDSLITGATIYRGTWDPDVSLNSGYGSPDLSGVTQTSGYYYICSADGTAIPNGAATEPNTWATGDWVIWNDDIGAAGEWQKIDNSSVLSGAGTGQTVALWEGASSVTDSETLGNSPITVSGIDVKVSAGLQLIRTSDPYMQFYEGSTNVGDIFVDTSLNNMVLRGAAGHAVHIKSNGNSDADADGIYLSTTNRVGINNTSPAKDLDVRGSLAISNGPTSYWYLDRNDSTGTFDINTDDNVTRLKIDYDSNITIGTSGGGINEGAILLQNDHYVNKRFSFDPLVSNSTTAYMILCENTANQDVNGIITMDRTSGLRHACSIQVLVSAGNGTAPVGGLKSIGVTGSGTPFYALVTCDYDDGTGSSSHIAVEMSNPDGYYETSGAYFTGRIVNSNDGIIVPVLPAAVSNVSVFESNCLHNFQGDVIFNQGNVGIGEDTPAQKLHVIGKTISSVDLTVGNNSSGAVRYSGQNGYYSFITRSNYNDWSLSLLGTDGDASTDPIGTQLVTVNYSGNFGIATTSPSYRLQIGVAGGLADSIRIGSYAIAKDTRQYIGYARADTGLFESSGSGDTPSTVLAGVAGIRIVNTEGTLASLAADNSVQLITHVYNGGSTVALHASYSGRVGIGTTSPDGILQVQAIASGNIYSQLLMGYNNASSNYYDGDTQTFRTGIGNITQMTLGAAGAIKFNAYDSTNNTGTPTYLLGTDASGNVVKTNTVPGSAAGPYLPLAGGTMTGVTQFNDHTQHGDQVQARWGASNDLTIEHNGTNSYIKDTGTGALFVETDYFRLVNPNAVQSMISANTGGAVTLYHGGSQKFITTVGGVEVTGDGIFTGDVGIGTTTTTAGSQLTLESSGSTGISILSASNTGECFINFSDGDDINPGQIFYGHSPDRMVFRAGDDSRMTILGSNGNVGIGTASPGAKLEVIGGTRLGGGACHISTDSSYSTTASYTFRDAVGINNPNSTSFAVAASVMSLGATTDGAGSSPISLVTTGRVGIGTSNPGNLLDVQGDTDISGQLVVSHNANYVAKVVQLATSMSNATYTFEIDSTAHTSNLSTAGAMSVDVDSGRAFTINGLGNVGIGTDSPAAKLFVDGKDASNNSSLMTRLDTTYAMGISNEWVSTYVSKLQLGRVGIGNNSNIDFIYDIAGTEYGSIKRNYTASSLKFERGTSVDMIINGSGNVGIGVTAPSATLDVDGAIRSRGGTYVGDVDTVTDVALLIDEEDYIYTRDSGNAYLRRLIGKTSNVINIGQTGTGLVTGIDLKPGTTGGFVQVFNNSTVTAKFVDGKLGIGTTLPEDKLEVSGGALKIKASANHVEETYIKFGRVDQADGSYENHIKSVTGSGATQCKITFAVCDTSATGRTNLLLLDGGSSLSTFQGRLGIGGTPSTDAKLEVHNGNLRVRGDQNAVIQLSNIAGNTKSQLGNAGNEGDLSLYTSANVKTVYLSSYYDSYINPAGGNVGINDTSPSNKLDVNGDIRATQYKLRGNVANPTDTAVTIYDQSTVGLTLSAHSVELRGWTGSAMVRSAFITHNTATFTGTCTATNFILSSDETLKDNIKEIESKHIDVNWKNFELKSEPGVKRSGVIAQELEKKHPEFVRTNDEGLKSVAYIDLLISKIAELEARLEKAGI